MILNPLPMLLKELRITYLLLLKVRMLKVELRSVVGFVTDESDEPMVGVSVIVNGTTIGQATDVDGKFEFLNNIPDGSVLMFSFIG